MKFDLAETKKKLRRIVHDTMSVDAVYTSPTSEVYPLRVRFHEKLVRIGDTEGVPGATSEVIEGVDRLIFDRDDLAARSITLRRGGKVEIPKYQMKFVLDVLAPNDGAVILTWLVTRE